MDDPTTQTAGRQRGQTRGRRALLQLAAAAAAAGVAVSVNGRALADHLGTLTIDGSLAANDGTGTTNLTSTISTIGSATMNIENTAGSGGFGLRVAVGGTSDTAGQRVAIGAYTSSGIAVQASSQATGVSAVSSGTTAAGIFARNTSVAGNAEKAVFAGVGPNIGATPTGRAGLYANNSFEIGAGDIGVAGVIRRVADADPGTPDAAVGVLGLGVTPGAVGVWAQSATADALHVEGTSTQTGNATFNGEVTTSGAGSKFVGNGLGLSALNASFLTTGTVPAARIPSLDASKITTGLLPATVIPSLDAAKVTSGTFSPNRIPSLDAGKITTGLLPAGVVPPLDAAKLATGTLDPARIPGLDASKITSGRLATNRLPRNVALRTSKVVPFAGTVWAGKFGAKGGKPAVFSSVGQAPVPAGKREVTVKAGGVGPKTHVLVTLQSDAGVQIDHIEKVKGGFKAVLAAPATKAATLAFFVVGQP